MTATHLAGFLAAVAVLVLLFYVPNPVRDSFRSLFSIRLKRLKKAANTPIERELALIAGPQKVIDDSQAQVQDLRGTLLHESTVLMQREDDLAAAEAQYYKAADDSTDTGIDELVLLVAEREQEVALQKNVVDGMQAAVVAACAGVDKARKELRRVQMTIKSDEAKARATQALDAAARVIDAARSITVNGSALNEASKEVNHDFEQARARLDNMQGSAAERELKQATDRQDLLDLRKRLDAKRANQSAPAQSQS